MHPIATPSFSMGGSGVRHRPTIGLSSRYGFRRVRLVLAVMLIVSGLLATTAGAASAAAPSNDRFGQATVISSLPFSDQVDTTEATRGDADPNCVDDGHTVWYSFSPSASGEIFATTRGSDYDTTLSVYTGDREDLILIACNDDFDGGTSAVQFEVLVGSTYYLMAGSYAGNGGGTLELTVDEFEPLAIDLTITGGRLDPRTGDAFVRGTVTCSAPIAAARIGIHLRQRRGDSIDIGRGSATVDCDTAVGKWRGLVLGRRALQPGWARIIAWIDVCGDASCATYETTRVISLRLRPL